MILADASAPTAGVQSRRCTISSFQLLCLLGSSGPADINSHVTLNQTGFFFSSSCCLGRSVQAQQVNLIYFESLQAINRRPHPIVSDKLRVLLTV